MVEADASLRNQVWIPCVIPTHAAVVKTQVLRLRTGVWPVICIWINSGARLPRQTNKEVVFRRYVVINSRSELIPVPFIIYGFDEVIKDTRQIRVIHHQVHISQPNRIESLSGDHFPWEGLACFRINRGLGIIAEIATTGLVCENSSYFLFSCALTLALPTKEEEHLILNDWPAHTASELIVSKGVLLVGNVVPSVKRVVAKILKEASVKCVATVLCLQFDSRPASTVFCFEVIPIDPH